MTEEMAVFTSYLRLLLEKLYDLQKAIDSGDIEKAKEITDRLIKDTRAGIEK